MKEATGELNMTVLTVVAIAAIAALFYAFVWPMIQRNIVQQTCNAYGTGYTARKANGDAFVEGSDKTYQWECCKGNDCIKVDE